MSDRGFGVRGAVWLALACGLAGCQVELMHDVDETAANEILAALHRRGIDGDKVRHTQGSKASYTVAVARGEAARAWQVLRQENLPRPQRAGLGEVFGQASLVPTATQERAMMLHALSGELSRSLQAVEGVLEARVHLVLPTADPLVLPDAPRPEPKASVLLRVGARATLTAEQVQRLVAGAVKDLSAAAVTVIIVPGQDRVSEPGAAPGEALASVGPFRVAAAGASVLRLTLLSGLGLVLVLAIVALALLRRARRLGLALARHPQARGPRDESGPHETSAPRADAPAGLESSLGLIRGSLAPRGRSRTTGAGRDSS